LLEQLHAVAKLSVKLLRAPKFLPRRRANFSIGVSLSYPSGFVFGLGNLKGEECPYCNSQKFVFYNNLQLEIYGYVGHP
jgi:hypothetical protein